MYKFKELFKRISFTNKFLFLTGFTLLLTITSLTLSLANNQKLNETRSNAQLACSENQCRWTDPSSGAQQCCKKYGDPMTCGTYECACLGRNCPGGGGGSTETCTIQGYKVMMPGNASVQPAISQTVYQNGTAKTTANPYEIKVNKNSTNTISVSVPAGYKVGYTLCLGSTGCHTETPKPGESVTFNCSAGYADLWWHYAQAPTPTTANNYVIQGYKVTMPGNQKALEPVSSQMIYLNGAAKFTYNPYFLTSLTPGQTYTVKVGVPAGYTVGYTMCTDVTTCHSNKPILGNSVTFKAIGKYTDLWWHYYPNPTATPIPSVTPIPSTYTLKTNCLGPSECLVVNGSFTTSSRYVLKAYKTGSVKSDSNMVASANSSSIASTKVIFGNWSKALENTTYDIQLFEIGLVSKLIANFSNKTITDCTTCDSKPADIMLVIDRSSTMQSKEPDGIIKLEKAKQAAIALVDSLSKTEAAKDRKIRIGIATFGRTGTESTLNSPLTTDFTALKSAISSIKYIRGGTCIECGLKLANTELKAKSASINQRMVILLSDGRANSTWNGSSTNAASEAVYAARAGKNEGYKYYVVGYGSNVYTSLLKEIASDPDDTYYIYRPVAADWASTFTKIGAEICKIINTTLSSN